VVNAMLALSKLGTPQIITNPNAEASRETDIIESQLQEIEGAEQTSFN
jgi:hypothetical protein